MDNVSLLNKVASKPGCSRVAGTCQSALPKPKTGMLRKASSTGRGARHLHQASRNTAAFRGHRLPQDPNQFHDLWEQLTPEKRTGSTNRTTESATTAACRLTTETTTTDCTSMSYNRRTKPRSIGCERHTPTGHVVAHPFSIQRSGRTGRPNGTRPISHGKATNKFRTRSNHPTAYSEYRAHSMTRANDYGDFTCRRARASTPIWRSRSCRTSSQFLTKVPHSAFTPLWPTCYAARGAADPHGPDHRAVHCTTPWMPTCGTSRSSWCPTRRPYRCHARRRRAEDDAQQHADRNDNGRLGSADPSS